MGDERTLPVDTPEASSSRKFLVVVQVLWLCGSILLIPAVVAWFPNDITDVFYRFPTEIEKPSPLWSQRFAFVNLVGLSLWGAWFIGLVWYRIRYEKVREELRSPSLIRGALIWLINAAQMLVTAVIAALTALQTLILLIDYSDIPV